MNKLKLLTLFLVSAFLIQSCKKDTFTGVAYTTAPFQANIDGSAWAPKPDSITNTIAYNSAAKTKVFYLMGTQNQKQVIWSVTLSNAINTAGFTLGTYDVDSAKTVTAQYNIQQKNSAGNYVFVPQGTAAPGAGSIIVTAIDSVKKQITGTFSFYSRTVTYDGSGNIISVNVDNILGGEFNNLPYTFTSN
jgi:hypothetical protein